MLDLFCFDNDIDLTLVIVGGAACILQYEVNRYTEDIDVVVGDFRGFDLQQFGISLVHKDFLNLPDEFVDRLHPVEGFKKIKVFTLDAIDIILTKLGRGNPKDIEDCKEVMRSSQINIPKLIDIFNDS